jgi:hypothetical protein
MNAEKKTRIKRSACGEEPATVLSSRILNRALLASQMLLSRVRLPVLEVIENLVDMQVQTPKAPYFGFESYISLALF